MRRSETTILDYLYGPKTLSAEAMFAEIEHLHEHGATPNEIATKLGRTPAALRTFAHHHNRPDIANILKETP